MLNVAGEAAAAERFEESVVANGLLPDVLEMLGIPDVAELVGLLKKLGDAAKERPVVSEKFEDGLPKLLEEYVDGTVEEGELLVRTPEVAGVVVDSKAEGVVESKLGEDVEAELFAEDETGLDVLLEIGVEVIAELVLVVEVDVLGDEIADVIDDEVLDDEDVPRGLVDIDDVWAEVGALDEMLDDEPLDVAVLLDDRLVPEELELADEPRELVDGLLINDELGVSPVEVDAMLDDVIRPEDVALADGATLLTDDDRATIDDVGEVEDAEPEVDWAKAGLIIQTISRNTVPVCMIARVDIGIA